MAPVNPIFEPTLKQNLVNNYCRQACYEAEKYLFQAEQEAYFGWVMDNVRAGNRDHWEWNLDETRDRLFDEFMAKPLCEMQSPCGGDLPGLIARAAEAIERIRL